MKTQHVHDGGTQRSGEAVTRASKRARRWSLLSAVAALTGVLFTSLPALADPLHVKDVKVSSPQEGTAEVLVATSAAPHFSARIAEGGLRLIIDIDGADVAGAPGAITQGNALVAGVMTQAFQQDGQPLTRVLVQLARPAEYRIVAEASGLRVVLTPSEKTAAMGAQPGKAPVRDAAPQATREGALLTDVRFQHRAGLDRVLIDCTSSTVEYALSSDSAGRSTLELKGVRLPDALQRKLDTGAFGGLVRAVSTYRRNSDPTHVIIEVERAPESSGVVTREGNTLVFSFVTGPIPSTLSGIGVDGGIARRSRTVAREESFADGAPKIETNYNAAAGVRESMVEPDQADAFMPSSVAAQQRRFSGNRIDLDLKDASVHEVLRLLSDVGHVNIITSDAVNGAVTIKVRNVPWDQALETVLQAKGLGMVRQGNMIRVAPLADLNKERELAIARRKSELQLAPVETRLIPVSYAEAKELQERAKDMLSPRGTLAVDERTNVIIARDVAGNLNQVEELIRSLDTQTPQVLIEARIVEATSRYLRDVGIQWGGDGTFSPATGNPTGLVFPSSVGLVGGASDQGTPTAGLSPFTN
ncbi:MAG: secretin N-terminal domain-containing protein, partial [Minicystis sp.]